MKTTAKIIFSLALTGLLNACSVYKPTISKASSSDAKPQVQADRKIYYIPPLKLPDKPTVENNMQKHRPYGTRKLNLYFSKAKVSYPPQEVIFIAMKQEKKTGTMGQRQRRVPLYSRILHPGRQWRVRPQTAPRRQASA